jgi:ferritin-like metal-binding protein YciE
MKLESFEKLFHVLLSDIYYTELLLVEEIPVMAKAAQSKELKEALSDHHRETKAQVARLERIFKLLGTAPLNIGWTTNLVALFAKAGKVWEDNSPSPVVDAAIIAASQRIEHYEISTYGTLIEFAHAMSLDAVKDLLKESIKEEAHANSTLTKVAKGGFFKAGVNQKALHR